MKTGVIQNEPNQLTEEKSLVGIAGITTRQEDTSDGWSPSSTTPCSSTDDLQVSPANMANTLQPTEGEVMTLVLLRRLFLVATPLALAVVLWFHPPGGEDVYEGVRGDVGAWLFVHTGFLLLTPLLAIAAYVLLGSLKNRAATVSRVALIFFLVFYTAYEVTVGVGTGILVDYANGLPPGEQAVVADAIQDYNRNWILSDPSLSFVLGTLGWVVAMVAAAVAFRRAGAGWLVTLLVGFAALFAVHPPPVGPVALLCFATASVLIEWARAREASAGTASTRTAI
jgi:hypothetical protein